MRIVSALAIILSSWIATCVHEVRGEEFIVFIHGLAGFGRDEMAGLGYWGFKGLPNGRDYVQWMQDQTGLKAFEASVGPFSSNWDRACELYAQIKGLRTDYGKAHARQFGHSRWGRDFRADGSNTYYRKGGFFPAWNQNNKVHLIGHSMGGQTIRFLERLLQQGDAAETALKTVASTGATSGGYVNDVGMSDLFQTGAAKDWIASVTTIASPLDGSTLHPILDSTGIPVTKYLKDLLLLIGGTLGNSAALGLYNMDLGHHTEFSSGPNSGESLSNYVTRIFSSPKWSGSYFDLADYDMSPHKMKLFNAAGPRVYPNTRYFAMSTWQTKTCALNWNDQCSDLDINPLMTITANIVGSVDDFFGNNDVKDKWGDVYNDSWEQNDGLVPRRSSTGPTYGVPTTGAFSLGKPIKHPTSWGSYVYGSSTLKKGQWYYTDVQRDHVQVIGLSVFWTPHWMYEHIRDIIKSIKYT